MKINKKKLEKNQLMLDKEFKVQNKKNYQLKQNKKIFKMKLPEKIKVMKKKFSLD